MVILVSFTNSDHGNINNRALYQISGTGCINVTQSTSRLQDSDKQLLALGFPQSRCVSSTATLIARPGSSQKLQKDKRGSLATDEPFRSRQ